MGSRDDDVFWVDLLVSARPTEIQGSGAGHTAWRVVFDWRLDWAGGCGEEIRAFEVKAFVVDEENVAGRAISKVGCCFCLS